ADVGLDAVPESGNLVPGAAAARAAPLDPVADRHLRQQPPRALLFPHRDRPSAAAAGDPGLGPRVRHRQPHPADARAGNVMREWLMRVLAVGRRGRRDMEFDEELRFHAEALARRFEAEGLDPSLARAVAERELGGIDRTRQAWRDQRTWLPLEELLQDARYAVRVLRRSKGLT